MDDLTGDFTPQELIFVYEYLKTFSIKQASKSVGYNYTNYSLLKKPHMRKLIRKAMKDRIKRLCIDSDWVLNELINLYETDFAELISINDKGEPCYDFSKASPLVLAALTSLNINPTKHGTSIKATLPTKLELLQIIGKHVNIGAWKEQIEQTGTINLHFDKQDSEA